MLVLGIKVYGCTEFKRGLFHNSAYRTLPLPINIMFKSVLFPLITFLAHFIPNILRIHCLKHFMNIYQTHRCLFDLGLPIPRPTAPLSTCFNYIQTFSYPTNGIIPHSTQRPRIQLGPIGHTVYDLIKSKHIFT